MGQYKDEIERSHGKMTPKQIRVAKCERSHLRNLQRQKDARAAAEERQENWAKLSPQEQIKALDERLGKGIGATKQRKRIMEKIEKQNG
jgi:hypothetical protein